MNQQKRRRSERHREIADHVQCACGHAQCFHYRQPYQWIDYVKGGELVKKTAPPGCFGCMYEGLPCRQFHAVGLARCEQCGSAVHVRYQNKVLRLHIRGRSLREKVWSVEEHACKGCDVTFIERYDQIRIDKAWKTLWNKTKEKD